MKRFIPVGASGILNVSSEFLDDQGAVT